MIQSVEELADVHVWSAFEDQDPFEKMPSRKDRAMPVRCHVRASRAARKTHTSPGSSRRVRCTTGGISSRRIRKRQW